MSVALHAVVALVVLRGRSGAPEREPKAPAEAIDLAKPAEPQLVEIEFLPAPPPPASLAAGAAVGPVGEPPQRLALQDHVHTTRVETAPMAATPPAAPPSRSLAMRAAVDLQLHGLHDGGPAVRSGPRVERPTEPAAPLAQPAAPDAGEPDPKQTHEAFAMNAEPDGTAHLHDTPNLRWVLGLPTKRDFRDRIDAWQDELAHAYAPPEPPVDRTPPRPIEHPIGSIGTTIMKFDVTDWMMRRHGDDPYASAKLAQLDATRPGRAQRGALYRHAELSRASDLMERNLERLWATVPGVAERKRQLFALWDECDETGSSDVIEATDHARKRVFKFVREHLPQGSREAFTDAELAALNRDKQSHASFAPYSDGID